MEFKVGDIVKWNWAKMHSLDRYLKEAELEVMKINSYRVQVFWKDGIPPPAYERYNKPWWGDEPSKLLLVRRPTHKCVYCGSPTEDADKYEVCTECFRIQEE